MLPSLRLVLSYLFAEEPHLKSTILCFVSFLWPGVRREGGLWPASMHVSKHELDGRNGHVPEALFNTWATLPLVPLTYMVYRVALTTLDVVGRIPCKWLRHKKGVWLHGGFTLQMVVLQIRKQEAVYRIAPSTSLHINTVYLRLPTPPDQHQPIKVFQYLPNSSHNPVHCFHQGWGPLRGKLCTAPCQCSHWQLSACIAKRSSETQWWCPWV